MKNRIREDQTWSEFVKLNEGIILDKKGSEMIRVGLKAKGKNRIREDHTWSERIRVCKIKWKDHTW